MKTLWILLALSSPFTADEVEVAKVLTEYQEAYNRRDAAALADLFAEDGRLLPPNRKMVVGKEAIFRFWRERLGAELSLKTLERRVGGDVAFVIGTYFLRGAADTGKFTVCLKRDRDGPWRIASDMWNSDKGEGFIPAAPPPKP